MLGFEASWAAALPPFLVATAACILLVPATMWLARGVGAVDEPDAHRRIHAEPTPRLGGLALFAGFALAVAVFGGAVPLRWQILAITGAICLFMAIDDILHLPWWTKLVLELAASLAVVAVGITITFIAVPGSHGTHVVELAWLTVPVTILWLVGMQTSVNLLDGSDGVAAGVVGIVAVVSLLAAANRIAAPGDLQTGVVVLSGALMGCCTGFLIFNLPPARVFMGDAGSHFLGAALGIITILGVAKVAVALSLFVPLIALGLPIGDTAAAIIRRRRAGRKITEPDAGHLHHRLLARGLSPTETALTFYLCTGILGCLALGIYGHRRVLFVSVGLLVIALIRVWRSSRRRRDADAEEGVVVVSGHPVAAHHIHHSGEAD